MASNPIDGLQPTSDGLQPNSDGLPPNSDGLQPNSNALQPQSEVLLTRLTLYHCSMQQSVPCLVTGS